MTKIITDASSIGRALLPDERDAVSEAILFHLDRSTLVEPAHWSIECTGFILKAARRGRVSAEQRAGLRMALASLIEMAEIEPQGRPMQAFDLAVAHQLSVYDAAYLDLAVETGLPLLTEDKALSKAALSLGLELIETL